MSPFRLLLPLAWLLLCLHCSADAPPQIPPEFLLPPQVTVLSPQASADLIVQHPDINIIDVRMLEEIQAQGTLPGAAHLDFLRGDFTHHLKSLVRHASAPTLIYCTLGGRSKRAATFAVRQGIFHVHIIDGGFRAWQQSGQSVIPRTP